MFLLFSKLMQVKRRAKCARLISPWITDQWRLWTRSIAMLIVLTFIFPYLTWAFQPGAYAAAPAGQPLYNQLPLVIPSKLGAVHKTYQGSDRLVVYIQDLHCNYEVQSNIARIIGELAEKQGVGAIHESPLLVAVEGDSTPIDVSNLESISSDAVKQETGEYFMRQGKLSGAEFYAATGKHPIHLEGVESAEQYAAARTAVGKFLNEESQGYVADLREALNALKPVLYTPALRAWDEKQTKFRSGDLMLIKYCTLLAAQARRQRLDLRPYPNLSLYLSRTESIFTEGVDSDALFAELERVEQTLRQGQYTRPEQAQLDEMLRRLDVMEKLLNISATSQDLAEFRAHPEAFQTKTFLDFIARQDAVAGAMQESSIVDADVLALNAYLGQVREFYRIADDRSRVFVANTLKQMKAYDTKLSVLVTGGFHTEGVLQELQRQGVSFICIRPRLEHQDLINPYFALLRNRKTPLEKLLEQNQEILALASYVNQQGVVKTHFQSIAAVLFDKLRWFGHSENIQAVATQGNVSVGGAGTRMRGSRLLAPVLLKGRELFWVLIDRVRPLNLDVHTLGQINGQTALLDVQTAARDGERLLAEGEPQSSALSAGVMSLLTHLRIWLASLRSPLNARRTENGNQTRPLNLLESLATFAAGAGVLVVGMLGINALAFAGAPLVLLAFWRLAATWLGKRQMGVTGLTGRVVNYDFSKRQGISADGNALNPGSWLHITHRAFEDYGRRWAQWIFEKTTGRKGEALGKLLAQNTWSARAAMLAFDALANLLALPGLAPALRDYWQSKGQVNRPSMTGTGSPDKAAKSVSDAKDMQGPQKMIQGLKGAFKALRGRLYGERGAATIDFVVVTSISFSLFAAGFLLATFVTGTLASAWVLGLFAIGLLVFPIAFLIENPFLVKSLKRVTNLVGFTRASEWEKSAGAKALDAIYAAAERQDVETLIALGNQAAERHVHIQQLIQDAEAAKAKVVNNDAHDKISQAKRDAVYERFVAGVAKLMLYSIKGVQDQASQGPGGNTSDFWERQLNEKEAEALRKKSEGSLAQVLDELEAELKRQEPVVKEIDQALEAFNQVRPILFAGKMKAAARKSEKQLELLIEEFERKSNLLNDKDAAMRGRVSDRLYGESQEFREHRDRSERLSDLLSEYIKPAVELLEEMAAQGKIQAKQENLARLNRFVPVSIPNLNEKGVPTSTTTIYQDLSGPYVQAANTAARAAAAAAREAELKINALEKSLKEMASLGVITREKLSDLSSLQTLLNKVEGRIQEETDWIDGEIDTDLAKQMSKAPFDNASRPSPQDTERSRPLNLLESLATLAAGAGVLTVGALAVNGLVLVGAPLVLLAGWRLAATFIGLRSVKANGVRERLLARAATYNFETRKGYNAAGQELNPASALHITYRAFEVYGRNWARGMLEAIGVKIAQYQTRDTRRARAVMLAFDALANLLALPGLAPALRDFGWVRLYAKNIFRDLAVVNERTALDAMSRVIVEPRDEETMLQALKRAETWIPLMNQDALEEMVMAITPLMHNRSLRIRLKAYYIRILLSERGAGDEASLARSAASARDDLKFAASLARLSSSTFTERKALATDVRKLAEALGPKASANAAVEGAKREIILSELPGIREAIGFNQSLSADVLPQHPIGRALLKVENKSPLFGRIAIIQVLNQVKIRRDEDGRGVGVDLEAKNPDKEALNPEDALLVIKVSKGLSGALDAPENRLLPWFRQILQGWALEFLLIRQLNRFRRDNLALLQERTEEDEQLQFEYGNKVQKLSAGQLPFVGSQLAARDFYRPQGNRRLGVTAPQIGLLLEAVLQTNQKRGLRGLGSVVDNTLEAMREAGLTTSDTALVRMLLDHGQFDPKRDAAAQALVQALKEDSDAQNQDAGVLAAKNLSLAHLIIRSKSTLRLPAASPADDTAGDEIHLLMSDQTMGKLKQVVATVDTLLAELPEESVSKQALRLLEELLKSGTLTAENGSGRLQALMQGLCLQRDEIAALRIGSEADRLVEAAAITTGKVTTRKVTTGKRELEYTVPVVANVQAENAETIQQLADGRLQTVADEPVTLIKSNGVLPKTPKESGDFQQDIGRHLKGKGKASGVFSEPSLIGLQQAYYRYKEDPNARTNRAVERVAIRILKYWAHKVIDAEERFKSLSAKQGKKKKENLEMLRLGAEIPKLQEKFHAAMQMHNTLVAESSIFVKVLLAWIDRDGKTESRYYAPTTLNIGGKSALVWLLEQMYKNDSSGALRISKEIVDKLNQMRLRIFRMAGAA